MAKAFKLRKTLFWDVDIKKINEWEKPDFIVGRVLDFGNIQEWKTIKNLYSVKKIKETAKKHIFPDARNANFWSIVLNIPFKELRCTRKPLLKTPRAFLRR